ncbi:MAG TPA: glyoxalase superfamily protein [Gemmatimonadales bacterium]|nr:glyoxalase superfamily protein [Gemmatimonadales bacterium]
MNPSESATPVPAFECITPILNVASIPASVGYYTDVLGFHLDWAAGEPPTMVSVSRDGHAIMLCAGDQGQAGTWVWIGVHDVEPLCEQYRSRGAKFRLPPTNYPWAHEMQVEDPDGHVLRFGSEPLSESSSSAGQGRPSDSPPPR